MSQVFSTSSSSSSSKNKTPPEHNAGNSDTPNGLKKLKVEGGLSAEATHVAELDIPPMPGNKSAEAAARGYLFQSMCLLQYLVEAHCDKDVRTFEGGLEMEDDASMIRYYLGLDHPRIDFYQLKHEEKGKVNDAERYVDEWIRLVLWQSWHINTGRLGEDEDESNNNADEKSEAIVNSMNYFFCHFKNIAPEPDLGQQNPSEIQRFYAALLTGKNENSEDDDVQPDGKRIISKYTLVSMKHCCELLEKLLRKDSKHKKETVGAIVDEALKKIIEEKKSATDKNLNEFQKWFKEAMGYTDGDNENDDDNDKKAKIDKVSLDIFYHVQHGAVDIVREMRSLMKLHESICTTRGKLRAPFKNILEDEGENQKLKDKLLSIFTDKNFMELNEQTHEEFSMSMFKKAKILYQTLRQVKDGEEGTDSHKGNRREVYNRAANVFKWLITHRFLKSIKQDVLEKWLSSNVSFRNGAEGWHATKALILKQETFEGFEFVDGLLYYLLGRVDDSLFEKEEKKAQSSGSNHSHMNTEVTSKEEKDKAHMGSVPGSQQEEIPDLNIEVKRIERKQGVNQRQKINKKEFGDWIEQFKGFDVSQQKNWQRGAMRLINAARSEAAGRHFYTSQYPVILPVYFSFGEGMIHTALYASKKEHIRCRRMIQIEWNTMTLWELLKNLCFFDKNANRFLKSLYLAPRHLLGDGGGGNPIYRGDINGTNKSFNFIACKELEKGMKCSDLLHLKMGKCTSKRGDDEGFFYLHQCPEQYALIACVEDGIEPYDIGYPASAGNEVVAGEVTRFYPQKERFFTKSNHFKYAFAAEGCVNFLRFTWNGHCKPLHLNLSEWASIGTANFFKCGTKGRFGSKKKYNKSLSEEKAMSGEDNKTPSVIALSIDMGQKESIGGEETETDSNMRNAYFTIVECPSSTEQSPSDRGEFLVMSTTTACEDLLNCSSFTDERKSKVLAISTDIDKIRPLNMALYKYDKGGDTWKCREELQKLGISFLWLQQQYEMDDTLSTVPILPICVTKGNDHFPIQPELMYPSFENNKGKKLQRCTCLVLHNFDDGGTGIHSIEGTILLYAGYCMYISIDNTLFASRNGPKNPPETMYKGTPVMVGDCLAGFIQGQVGNMNLYCVILNFLALRELLNIPLHGGNSSFGTKHRENSDECTNLLRAMLLPTTLTSMYSNPTPSDDTPTPKRLAELCEEYSKGEKDLTKAVDFLQSLKGEVKLKSLEPLVAIMKDKDMSVSETAREKAAKNRTEYQSILDDVVGQAQLLLQRTRFTEVSWKRNNKEEITINLEVANRLLCKGPVQGVSPDELQPAERGKEEESE